MTRARPTAGGHLLHGPPSEARWRALCRSVDRASAAAIDEVSDRIVGWPDGIREAPWAWLRRTLAGEDVPALRLARVAAVCRRRVGDAAIGRLVASANVRSLQCLALYDNLFGPAGARAIADSPHLGGLGLLLLGDNRLGDEGAQALARARGLGGLATLSVCGADIGDEGAVALVEGSGLPLLRNLDLEGNRITAAGAARIAATPGLSRFDQLQLDDNPIGDQGRAALAASPHRRPGLQLAWVRGR